MDQFTLLCKRLTDTSPPVENIDKPIKDWTQDAWERTIVVLQQQGRQPENVFTSEEWRRSLEPDAGLVVNAYSWTIRSHFRESLRDDEYSARKTELLSLVFSLDNDAEDDAAFAEIIEDFEAERPFHFAECYDLIINDPRFRALTEVQLAAVKRFALAWIMQQEGYPITRAMSTRLSRDRKLTGLPLVLDQGRTSGAG